jgi:hypothetical protein
MIDRMYFPEQIDLSCRIIAHSGDGGQPWVGSIERIVSFVGVGRS